MMSDVYTCVVSKIYEAGGGVAITPASAEWSGALGALRDALGLSSSSYVSEVINAAASGNRDTTKLVVMQKYDLNDGSALAVADKAIQLVGASGCAGYMPTTADRAALLKTASRYVMGVSGERPLSVRFAQVGAIVTSTAGAAGVPIPAGKPGTAPAASAVAPGSGSTMLIAAAGLAALFFLAK
jgi:hypothetical protein